MEMRFRGINIKTGEMVFSGGIDSQRDTPIIINHGERYFVDVDGDIEVIKLMENEK